MEIWETLIEGSPEERAYWEGHRAGIDFRISEDAYDDWQRSPCGIHLHPAPTRRCAHCEALGTPYGCKAPVGEDLEVLQNVQAHMGLVDVQHGPLGLDRDPVVLDPLG